MTRGNTTAHWNALKMVVRHSTFHEHSYSDGPSKSPWAIPTSTGSPLGVKIVYPFKGKGI